MMKTIINDLSNIKLATLYGWKHENTPDARELAIREFSDKYFGDRDDPQSPCRDPDVRYIFPESLEGDKKHCSHPKTYQMMDETLKSAYALVKETEFFDGEKMIQTECKHPKTNIFACAMANRGMSFIDSDWKSYQNVLLNENFFYQLFSLYYRQQITSNAKYSPLSFKTYSDSAEKAFKESQQIVRDSNILQEAIQETNRMLLHNAVSFPVHIALSAYKEDIAQFRSSLAKIFTPLHQLYYTLRNAQSCQE